MPDVLISFLAAALAVLGAATFAVMIWAAHQVDGRPHRLPVLRHRDRRS